GAGFLLAKGLNSEAFPPVSSRAPGAIGWRELMAGEWKSAFAFYEKLFGWTKAEAFEMGPMGTYQLFATGAEPVGGMMTKPDAIPVPNWGYYFNVDAIDAAAERVKAAGGKVLMGPAEVPGPMYILQCMDSLGAYFALVAPKR
ncbi:MAG: VOC family protein, partial [Proteobacteria bacterium]|nr:VOC family protein [Pseudomonadota bacterium]